MHQFGHLPRIKYQDARSAKHIILWNVCWILEPKTTTSWCHESVHVFGFGLDDDKLWSVGFDLNMVIHLTVLWLQDETVGMCRKIEIGLHATENSTETRAIKLVIVIMLTPTVS